MRGRPLVARPQREVVADEVGEGRPPAERRRVLRRGEVAGRDQQRGDGRGERLGRAAGVEQRRRRHGAGGEGSDAVALVLESIDTLM